MAFLPKAFGSTLKRRWYHSDARCLTNDCLMMALADEYGTRDIFGFDKQFAEAGYRRLEPSTDWKEAVRA
jgi:predicted nucleic acid-binding protein